MKIFADRDADQLYDDFAITHPDQESYLMPGSMPLWNSPGMKNKNLVTAFLAQYGLTREAVENPERQYLLVDTGFKGSTTDRLDGKIGLAYNIPTPLKWTGRLHTKLLCAEEARFKTGAVTDFGFDTHNNRWPKHDQAHGEGAPYPDDLHGNTYGLVYGMQLMPRYRARHVDLVQLEDGRLLTVPDPEELPSDNVDGVQHSVSDSVVNPLAAAIVQYRVVRAALERSGHLGVDTQAPKELGIS